MSFIEFHLCPRAFLCLAGEKLMLRSVFSLSFSGTLARTSGELDLHFLRVIWAFDTSEFKHHVGGFLLSCIQTALFRKEHLTNMASIIFFKKSLMKQYYLPAVLFLLNKQWLH